VAQVLNSYPEDSSSDFRPISQQVDSQPFHRMVHSRPPDVAVLPAQGEPRPAQRYML
jgi:hypothetical protein